MAKVICINNNKGGSLKTTVTTNIAGVLATHGKKVLIIDADNQANVSLSFGQNPDQYEDGLFQVLTGEVSASEAIVNVADNIDMIPANSDLIGFDFTIIGNPTKYNRPFNLMRETCGYLRDDYDYILIDTPPSLSLMVGNAFTFADEVLIPFTPENYSMRSLVKVLETLEDFKDQFNPKLKVLGVLATLVNFRTNLHTEVMQETRKYAKQNGVTFFDTFIPQSIRFASSVAYEGVPATISINKQTRERGEVFYELWKEIESK